MTLRITLKEKRTDDYILSIEGYNTFMMKFVTLGDLVIGKNPALDEYLKDLDEAGNRYDGFEEWHLDPADLNRFEANISELSELLDYSEEHAKAIFSYISKLKEIIEKDTSKVINFNKFMSNSIMNLITGSI